MNSTKLWQAAYWASLITIFYNVIEGIISVTFGYSDANCTKACIYLSIILLVSSVLYEVFKIGYIDSLGALGIAYYALKEGKEAFAKASEKKYECCE